MNISWRILSAYPWPETRLRKEAPFLRTGSSAGSWARDARRIPLSQTLSDLDRELRMLSARDVVIEVDMEERRLRRDGQPLADAPARSPRVVVSFASRHGPLRYGADQFDRWTDNLRAIALSLQALRTVDRYGVTKRGEQYSGWKAIPPSTGAVTSTEAAAKLIAAADPEGEWDWEDIVGDLSGTYARDAIRAAQKRTHPDAGGSTEAFQRVMQAKAVIEAHLAVAR